jgi:hypothetical protein
MAMYEEKGAIFFIKRDSEVVTQPSGKSVTTEM